MDNVLEKNEVKTTSFSADLKNEICAQPIKKICCRKAMAAGLIYSANLKDGKLCVSLPTRQCADFAYGIFKGIFGREAEEREIHFCGKTSFELSFASKHALEIYSAFDGADAETLHSECANCASYFLRGVFITSGSITDPQKAFHLEFKYRSPLKAKRIYELLQSEGYEGKIVNRDKYVGIYFKTYDTIEDVVTYLGANASVFDLINAKIERDIRNNENRATNCVAKNIMKSVSASSKQFEAIEKLIYHGLFETLPEELRKTASIRYSNIDLPLSEIAKLHDPPISKSGLNHRLQKIIEIANDLKF